MNFCKCLLALSFSFFLCSTWISCETVKVRGGQSDNTINPEPTQRRNKGNINTQGFLVTQHADLKIWLDKPYEVKYISMTPQLIFAQEPLREVRFQTSNLPVEALPFNFQSKDITRRELLKKISNFWNLKMSIVTGADGEPSAINVVGKN